MASRRSRVDFLSFATRDVNVFQSAEPFELKTSSNIVSRVRASSSPLASHEESNKDAEFIETPPVVHKCVFIHKLM